jgi:hypothetical protein
MDFGQICRVGSVAVVLIATAFSELRHHGAPSGMIGRLSEEPEATV